MEKACLAKSWESQFFGQRRYGEDAKVHILRKKSSPYFKQISVDHNEFTLNPVPFSRIHYECTICFANASESAFFSCIRCLLCKFIFNHFESTIDMAYSHEILFPRMHLKFKIWFAYSPWIHQPFREITINPLSASRFLLNFTIVFGNCLSLIHLGSNFSAKSL